jgi:hypothetical protein
VNDGLDIVLALAAVVAPLVLVWFLCAKWLDAPAPPHAPPRRK